jgi:hypothetical protein
MTVGELAISQYSVRMYAGSTGTMIGCGGGRGVVKAASWARVRERRRGREREGERAGERERVESGSVALDGESW